MQTRRQFVARAGTAAAAAILAPAGARPGPAPRRSRAAGSFAEGVHVRRPDAAGDHALVAPARRRRARRGRARGGARQGLPPRRRAQAHRDVEAPRPRAQGARRAACKPHEQYYYRFATRTTDGPVGRFRTALPADSHQPVRFAFWSCQDYTHGFYNAHDVLAHEDLDFVVCLGDYIYAESYHVAGRRTGCATTGSAARARTPSIVREAITLDDYRAKYTLYRSDPALRSVHASSRR